MCISKSQSKDKIHRKNDSLEFSVLVISPVRGADPQAQLWPCP